MKSFYSLAASVIALMVGGLLAMPPQSVAAPAYSNAVILIIRHAEKPETGNGLTPVGQQHALNYVHYFETYTIGSKPIQINALYASKDSAKSARPRLTIEPLGEALHLPISAKYKDKDFQDLAEDLKTQSVGKNVVICWHHGEIPDLLDALGADPTRLLPNGKWPGEQFSWVMQLCYDASGHLIPSKTMRVDEHL